MRRGHLRKAATEKRRFKNVMVVYQTPLKVELTDEMIELVIKTIKTKGNVRDLSVLNIDKKLTREISGAVSVNGVAIGRDGTEYEVDIDIKNGRVRDYTVEVLGEEEGLSLEAQEFVDYLGEDTAKEILETLGFEFDDIDDFQDNGDSLILEFGSQSWIGFRDYSDAESFAQNYVREMLESEPETFNQNWLMNYVDEDVAQNFFWSVYNEWNHSYAEDINSERSSQGYDSRLTDELVERGIVSEEDVLDEETGDVKEGWDPTDYIDDFVEKMTDDQISEGQGGYDHYKFNFGQDEAQKLLVEQNLIDFDAAADDAVNTDGVAHFLNHYDGNEYEADGTYWYRQN